MIRDDLKEKLDGKNLDEVFLKHRPGIDQPGHRVGKVGEEVVVLNESSGKIMDYFYDDVPDKEWYNLSLYNPEYERHEINKNTGRVRHINKTEKMLAISNHNGYHRTKTYIKRKCVNFFIHVCLGHIFIPNLNPDKNYIIDHIDRNRSNNSLNNLRWVDSKISRENQNRGNDGYRFQYFAYSDKEMNNLVYKFDCPKDIILILKSDGGSTNHNSIRKGIDKCINKKSNYYRGYYWRKENVILNQYLEHIGYNLNNVDLSDFKYNPIYDIKVNIKLGIFCTKQNIITCGFISGRYYLISIGRKNYTTSHIIWSTANGCVPFPEGKEADHINSDPLDNRAVNLQLVDSHSDNMKNPNTQAKIKSAKEAKKTQKN